jgi:hypothetical protein
MTDRISSLNHRFRQQQQFAASYSPLYAALFGTCADWLANDADNPLVQWLVKASEGRAAFDVTNLLAAGLHREVLMGSKEVSALAEFYPTVDKVSSTETLLIKDSSGIEQASPHFVQALREAILARRGVLQLFIQTYTVQTNETGRGIAWLLPASLAGWDGIHLVDIGASAGLNLVAEQRAYRFVDKVGNRKLLDLGYGQTRQFVIQTTGEAGQELPDACGMQMILSRTGCDLHPFQLQTAVDEQTLASFVWADHLERSQRLREGIAAFHEISQSNVPVRLHAVRLPQELPRFLDKQIVMSQEPVVIYNTYIKMYLPDKGATLRTHISRWAEEQQRPVLWIQWEPPNCVAFETGHEPEYGWLAWTLDHWHDGKHEQRQIGWVHPHGQQLQWLPGLQRWISYWRDARRTGDGKSIRQ